METQSLKPRPSLFEYENYRSFLKDYFTFSKQQLPQFSYRYFAQKAGFRSPNFLKLVMDGKRNLSSQSIEQFSKAFKLSSIESEFFSYLVHFNQSEDDAQKILWAKKDVVSSDFILF